MADQTPRELLDEADAAFAHWRQLLTTDALDPTAVSRARHDDRAFAETRLQAALQQLGAFVLSNEHVRAAFVEAGVPQAAPPPPSTDESVEPPPVSTSTPPRAEVTDEVLEGLRAALTEGRVFAPQSETTAPAYIDPTSLVAELLRTLPALREKTPESEVDEGASVTLDGVARVCAQDRLPPTAARAIVECLATRMRHYQTQIDPNHPAFDKTVRGIRRLTGFVKETQPGFVYGLSLAHTPQNGNWTQDATVAEEALRGFLPETTINIDNRLRLLTAAVRDGALPSTAFNREAKELIRAGLPPKDPRLVNLAIPFAEKLDGKVLAPLRTAVRAALEEEAEETTAENAPAALLAQTQSRRVAIIGGDPRIDRAEKLKEYFGFASIDWYEGSTVRKVDSLVERIRSGSVDLVVVLRAFNSHRVTDALFAERDHCDVVLADTYSVTQVRLGLERFLKDKTED